MGISKDLSAQIQSHGLGGVQDRHYDRHEYMDEKRRVLKAWARAAKGEFEAIEPGAHRAKGGADKAKEERRREAARREDGIEGQPALPRRRENRETLTRPDWLLIILKGIESGGAAMPGRACGKGHTTFGSTSTSGQLDGILPSVKSRNCLGSSRNVRATSF